MYYAFNLIMIIDFGVPVFKTIGIVFYNFVYTYRYIPKMVRFIVPYTFCKQNFHFLYIIKNYRLLGNCIVVLILMSQDVYVSLGYTIEDIDDVEDKSEPNLSIIGFKFK